jgi:hypothetical protein
VSGFGVQVSAIKKFQITKHKYQTDHNDRNSKFDTAESFDPESCDLELTTEGLVAGQTIGF